MAQPQPQIPPRAFSPPQHSPSPAGSQSGFALPPNKRPRTDGPQTQPEPPYATSPYAVSPGAVGTPPMTAGSPQYAQTPPVTGGFATPYTNGNTGPGLNLPDTRPMATSPLHTPQPVTSPATTLTPVANATVSFAQAPGVMGPPQRPADRPTKDYEYDVTDSLAGTGIDLRAEEQYMSELYSNGFDANADARTGFSQHPAGPKSTFYGAGPANQPAQSVAEQDQDKFAAEAAEKAWAESTMRLATQRTQEINDPFLLVALLHRRADKIAREHGVQLNMEIKNNSQAMGKMRLPDQFPTPKVTVRTVPGPDSTTVQTTGSFVPQDAFLVDQLALMSIATKQRLRELVEDANGVASNRQKTSHGDVPEGWAAAADPMNREPLAPMEDAGNATLPDSAVDPGTNPLKRSADPTGSENGPSRSKMPKISSFMTATMREMAKREREWEEARLRKRQKRRDGGGDPTSTPSRSNSIAPSTPGSVAPEPGSERAMTKKEMKKNQALKAAEANSHANQNLTSSMFAGLGGKSGLFGKNKKSKTYDWMNVGRSGSGTSTPTRTTSGPGKGPAGPGTPVPGNMALTSEGRNRLGTWREDKEKGKHIQLRDWVVVLERDGRETKALQRAYIDLDSSTPR